MSGVGGGRGHGTLADDHLLWVTAMRSSYIVPRTGWRPPPHPTRPPGWSVRPSVPRRDADKTLSSCDGRWRGRDDGINTRKVGSGGRVCGRPSGGGFAWSSCVANDNITLTIGARRQHAVPLDRRQLQQWLVLRTPTPLCMTYPNRSIGCWRSRSYY